MNDHKPNNDPEYIINISNKRHNAQDEVEFNEYDNNKRVKDQDYGNDDKLNYILLTLGLEDLIHIFKENNISFIDLLLLSKESLKELGLEMYQRNRIFKFSSTYNKKAKAYTMEEIFEFFESNKQFLFNTSLHQKLLKSNKKLNIKNDKRNLINKFKSHKYLSDDESGKNCDQPNANDEFSSGQMIRNSKNRMPSYNKNYKASQIFKKYLLIKKGVDEFLNKLNKQKEETEILSYKYNNIIKRINNNNYNSNDENDVSIPKTRGQNTNINNETNKKEEYNKLLEKINQLGQMKIDENSSEHLNQVKNYIHDNGENLMVDEILSLQAELDKITEIINKKEKLKQNLEKYNKKIEQRKQLIYELENQN
jgi:hypothetical protein